MFSVLQLVLPCPMNWQFSGWCYEKKHHKFPSRDSLISVWLTRCPQVDLILSVYIVYVLCINKNLPISSASCSLTLARSKLEPNKSKKGVTALTWPFLTYIALKSGISFSPPWRNNLPCFLWQMLMYCMPAVKYSSQLPSPEGAGNCTR